MIDPCAPCEPEDSVSAIVSGVLPDFLDQICDDCDGLGEQAGVDALVAATTGDGQFDALAWTRQDEDPDLPDSPDLAAVSVAPEDGAAYHPVLSEAVPGTLASVMLGGAQGPEPALGRKPPRAATLSAEGVLAYARILVEENRGKADGDPVDLYAFASAHRLGSRVIPKVYVKAIALGLPRLIAEERPARPRSEPRAACDCVVGGKGNLVVGRAAMSDFAKAFGADVLPGDRFTATAGFAQHLGEKGGTVLILVPRR
jgi:hypothetical protein